MKIEILLHGHHYRQDCSPSQKRFCCRSYKLNNLPGLGYFDCGETLNQRYFTKTYFTNGQNISFEGLGYYITSKPYGRPALVIIKGTICNIFTVLNHKMTMILSSEIKEICQVEILASATTKPQPVCSPLSHFRSGAERLFVLWPV